MAHHIWTAVLLLGLAGGFLGTFEASMRLVFGAAALIGAIGSLLSAVTHALDRRQARRHAEELHRRQMDELAAAGR